MQGYTGNHFVVVLQIENNEGQIQVGFPNSHSWNWSRLDLPLRSWVQLALML